MGNQMKYARIDELEYVNGEGIGVSLFVQGCPFHCKGCFNEETWSYDGGEIWTSEVEDQFMKLIDRPYITRVSILGGEPLSDRNLQQLSCLLVKIRTLYPKINIWLYTGFTWEQIFDECDRQRQKIVMLCDVLVDGPFIEEQKDLTLKWRGSKNQNVINIKAFLDGDIK